MVNIKGSFIIVFIGFVIALVGFCDSVDFVRQLSGITACKV